MVLVKNGTILFLFDFYFENNLKNLIILYHFIEFALK
jgi:hypothetical protein